MVRHSRLLATGVAILLVMQIAISGGSTFPQAKAEGPSEFCHNTDGNFTVCPNSELEWSDVPAILIPESGAYLYADQADLDPAISCQNNKLC
jgi:hypothetical protein